VERSAIIPIFCAALSFSVCPTVMAQHGRPIPGRPPQTGRPPQNNGGTHQLPPHQQPSMPAAPRIDPRAQQEWNRKIQEEELRATKARGVEMERLRQLELQSHQERTRRFEEWLKTNGGGSRGSGQPLPSSPEAFQQWMKTQKERKAYKKSYDERYDQFRAFANEDKPGGARSAQTQNQRHARSSTAAPSATAGTSTQPNQAPKESKPTAKNVAAKPVPPAAGKKALGKETTVKKTNTDASAVPVLAQDQPSIGLMRMVHSNLSQADHDYDGFRVRAMRSVNEALHHVGSSSPHFASASGSGGMPQAKSDQILRESISKLNVVATHFKSTASATPRHVEAGRAIARAIRELETALTIR
jgi:hypothetical protein